MLVDLLRVTTRDGVRLDGALWPADSVEQPPVDAVVLVHGTGSNFYGSTLTEFLAQRFIEMGTAALAVNTRGHDLLSTAATNDGPLRQGAAYEIVDDCRHDLTAWIDLLVTRGMRRVGLVGHSLGALKSVYFLAHEGHANAAWVAAVSPPRLSAAHFLAGPKREQFAADLAEAEAHVAAGRASKLMDIRFPLPYSISAAGYVDKYGPAERYNLLRLVDGLSCPALFTFGGQELQTNAAFQGLAAELEALDPHRQRWAVKTVADADHFYSAARDGLWSRIGRWLKKR